MTNEWTHRGDPNCKGQSRTERIEGGRLKITCDSCPLEWTTVDKSAKVRT